MNLDGEFRMTRRELAAAFNEWQRQSLADPSAFQSDADVDVLFAQQIARGEEPIFGAQSVAVIEQLVTEARQGVESLPQGTG